MTQRWKPRKPKKKRQPRIPSRSFELRHVKQIKVGEIACFDDGFMGTFRLLDGKPIVVGDTRSRGVTSDDLLVEVFSGS